MLAAGGGGSRLSIPRGNAQLAPFSNPNNLESDFLNLNILNMSILEFELF
jgi:hypothetical protein